MGKDNWINTVFALIVIKGEIMKKEEFWQFIKHPPIWLSILTYCLTLVFSTLSIVLLVLNLAEKIYSYIVFILAAITLTYAVFLFVRSIPLIKVRFIDTLKKYKFTRKIYEDYSFRTIVFSCSSLIFNFCFGAFEIIMGAVAHSIWFGSLGLYHLILSSTRFGIVYRYYKQSKTQEVNLEQKLKTYKNTGVCILIFNLALAGAMGQMIFSRRAFEYIGLMIFFIATYAFYKITVSIIGIYKAKKHNDYNTQSLRNLNLTDAMVSLYALQTALIETFDVAGTDMSYMNMATGIVVTAISIFIGIYMIVKSRKEIKKLN